MPRYLALEWDGSEARVVVANARRDAVSIDEAFVVDLAPKDPGQTFADPNVGQAIATALSARGIGRATTLVAVGRASIELKLLAIPEAPEDELPDMVRFQALREFTTIAEDWPLDFVNIPADDEQPGGVLAAAISPEMVEQIGATCEAAGLTPTHLVLRPCAAASLLKRLPASSGGQVRLLVDPLADEADLTVLVDQTVVFMRTARLSASYTPEDRSRSLVTEIRRTLASVHNQLAGRRVGQIYICAGGDDQEMPADQFADRIAEQLDVPAVVFNPFEVVADCGRVAIDLPANPGRFAPLLGMLLDEVQQARHAIDFLHPKRKPPPPSRKRMVAIAGAGALAVVVMLAGMMWMRMSRLNSQITGLTEDSKTLDRNVAQANSIIGDVTLIDEWVGGDTNWLDELYRTSKEFPPAEKAMLTQMRIATGKKEDAMHISGVSIDSDVIKSIHGKLRDARHRVERHTEQHDEQLPAYPWRFDSSVYVEADQKE